MYTSPEPLPRDDGFPRVILLADSIEEAVQHIQSLDTDTQPV